MPQPADLILRGPHAQVQQQLPRVQALQSSLPPSWTAETDPGSGHVYYHNMKTGETQWEVPQWGAPPPRERARAAHPAAVRVAGSRRPLVGANVLPQRTNGRDIVGATVIS